MTQQEQKEKLSDFQRQMSDTIISKASDYATADVLSNFKLVAQICNISVEKVIDVFLATKVVRKCNLTGSKASNESTDDTLLDLANYSFLSTLKDVNPDSLHCPSDLDKLNDSIDKSYQADLGKLNEEKLKHEPLEVGDYVEVLKWIVDGVFECKAVEIMEGGIFKVEGIYPARESYNYKVNGYFFPQRVLRKVNVIK